MTDNSYKKKSQAWILPMGFDLISYDLVVMISLHASGTYHISWLAYLTDFELIGPPRPNKDNPTPWP